MAKWKEPTGTELTAQALHVDPRIRMKEVRAMVANHMNGKAVNKDLGHLAHLGDLPDNMEDARRVIIALQDLLENERVKHRKATQHICSMVHIFDGMADYQMDVLDTVDQQGRQLHQMRQQLDMAEEAHVRMSKEARQSAQERDAVLTTMRLLNGQPTRPAYNAASPLPMMAMGLSNKDRL